jgi:acetyl esterase/lipase
VARREREGGGSGHREESAARMAVRLGITLTIVVALLGVLPGRTARAPMDAAPQPQSTMLLWPGRAPGAGGELDEDRPSLTVWLPPGAKATRQAILICPGGGYGFLAVDHEGRQIAEWLVRRGIVAAMLRYRIAPRYHHPAPMQDVLRAMRAVRAHASEWHVDPARIGIWGFSAGGHLAATACTQFTPGDPASTDRIERVSARPDFAILCYPVISMRGPAAHAGSRENLLGKQPDPALVARLSLETQVRKDTPPTFLFHTADDEAVPAENALLYYQALQQQGVPAELHLYEHGPHGVGLAQGDPALRHWPDRLADWLRGR